MPVRLLFNPHASEPQNPPRRGNRGMGFDNAVRAVAPEIRRLNASGRLAVPDLARALEAAGVRPPSGNYWSWSATQRVLVRGEQLGKLERGVCADGNEGVGHEAPRMFQTGRII